MHKENLLELCKSWYNRILVVLITLLTNFSSKLTRLLYKLYSTDYGVVLFLAFFSFITTVPWLLFITTGDPSDDSAFYLNWGKNLSDGNGYTSDFKEYFYSHDGHGNNNSIEYMSYQWPPLYSIFLSLVFKIHYSVHAASWYQTFLFCLFIIIYYNFVKESFGNNVAFFSSFFIIIDTSFYFNSVRVMTDLIALLFVIITFYAFNRYHSSNNIKYIIVLGLSSALSYMGKIPNFSLFIIFSFYFFTSRKYKEFSTFLLSYMIIFVPWLLLLKINTGHFFIDKLYRDFPIFPQVESDKQVAY